ncbi:hypothetical protein GCM10011487_25440 [Steroidobacter agaridevorans]|uniref:Uncharacterized protein n=1 Tax=Steroidobacter agaridevorans TaxID=2695856 RepID=A0A829YB03_9GAMM|nr:hypothetical protein [Steroidobacter agaridevorans]GFE80544.1 hypothetical protein GCM10011487_25440 [Steroidobacter agaridevorans]
MANDQRLRRFVVFVLVAGAHVMLLMVPFEPERLKYEGHGRDDKRTQLFFPRPPDERRSLRGLRPPAEPEIRTSIVIDAPSAISAAPIAEDPAPGTGPSINWSEEAHRAAAAAAARAPIPDRSKCDSTGLGDPALPNCKPPPEFKWAPPRAGFSNGLPYMTVGERCVIGLGFFGCGIGKKPPARGDLFEGMDDPEREPSSVPEP